MKSAAMEQTARYWGMSGGAVAAAACSSSCEPSWEEQAFARDAAASLVWPPRSYSCSFCRREFRSAQALGGHMNVHRRDRARLRAQAGDDVDDDVQEDQPHQERCVMDRAVSNPSCAATPSSTTTPPSPSYLSAIIRESKNSKVFMPIYMAAAREQVIYIDDKHDHGGAEEGSGRVKKRRRVNQPPPPVALPIFVRSSTAAAAAALMDLEETVQGFGIDRDAKIQGFGLDHAKVPETTASPSSSSTLVDQQEVDLELRLGH